MGFTKIELNIIYYVLISKVSELENKLRSTDDKYINEIGEIGVTDKEMDEFLYEELGRLIEKIRDGI